MWPTAPFFPEQASDVARSVDHLFLFALAGLVVFSTLIAVLILFFAIKFQRRRPDEIGVDVYETSPKSHVLEIVWSAIPLGLMMVLFVWGLRVYFEQNRPPANAAQFYVTGKQWMWKIQHPEGKREINELHVPKGKPIRLRMISEDVIHDFFVPAFRIHVDVLPSRYTTYWFEANKTGTFHLFCGQYCGVEHSRMVGHVIVMEPHEYEAWLKYGNAGPSVLASGEELFAAKACNTCHRPDSAARAPILNGIVGTKVALADGSTVTVNDDYIRESILNPASKVVAGYQPLMPTFKGTITEEELMQLVNYVKSLSKEATKEPAKTAEATKR
jgi:cytochrome c oxidase subunit 2